MRTQRIFRLLPLFLLLAVISFVSSSAKKYDAVFNFGDSLVDAGNLCADGIPAYLATARLPYGMNYFGYPTSRCSDGRVVPDFIVQELGMPLLPPSKAHNASFHGGPTLPSRGPRRWTSPSSRPAGWAAPSGTPAPCTPSSSGSTK